MRGTRLSGRDLVPDDRGCGVHGWAYANPVEAMQQTGVMPKPEEKPALAPAASK